MYQYAWMICGQWFLVAWQVNMLQLLLVAGAGLLKELLA